MKVTVITRDFLLNTTKLTEAQLLNRIKWCANIYFKDASASKEKIQQMSSLTLDDYGQRHRFFREFVMSLASSRVEIVILERLKTEMPLWYRSTWSEVLSMYRRTPPSDSQREFAAFVLFSAWGGEVMEIERDLMCDMKIEYADDQLVDPYPDGSCTCMGFRKTGCIGNLVGSVKRTKLNTFRWAKMMSLFFSLFCSL